MLSKINVYSHHFVVTPHSSTMTEACYKFIKEYLMHTTRITNTIGNVIAETTKVYATSFKDRSAFRFHRNNLDHFIKFLELRGIKETDYEYTIEPLFNVKKIDIELKPEYKPRPAQEKAIDFILDDSMNNFKLLSLNTGGGKTISTFFAMEKMRYRTIAFMRPSFIDRWLDEINKVFIKINPIVIQGSENLKTLMSKTISGELDWDIALISNKTYAIYLSNYKIYKDELLDLGYESLPQDFMRDMQSGFRVIDEVHLDFHSNFILDLHTHTEKSLSLSASLVNRDRFVEGMYEIAYPISNRLVNDSNTNYIVSINAHYNISSKYNITYNRRGTKVYNHIVYEQSIMKFPKILKGYLKMIDYFVENIYIDNKETDDKLIIFAASIEMCEKIVDYLKDKHSDLTITKYTGGDDYSNLIESDIRVSTIGSAGTAHDIPNLTTAIMTVAIDSVQSNMQSLGRLRDNKEKTMRVVYLINESIQKHIGYKRNRQNLLRLKSKSIKDIFYNQLIGE